MDERLPVVTRNQPDSRRHRGQDLSHTARPRGVRTARPRSGVEIVRPPDGPIEISLSGLVGPLERRARWWRAVALGLVVGLVVAASMAVVVLALRWDYQRGHVVQLLRADLEMEQARARCWEALSRYAPRSPEDVIPLGKRTDWVRQCVAVELARLNANR